MRIGLAITLLAALAATPVVAATAWQAPKNAFGQPDLEGFWTNATLTPMTRDRKLGARTTFTKEEVAKIQGELQAGIDKGNKPTDPNVGAPAVDGILQARGGTQIDGNYNRGWFDPGSSVMYVGGQARNSILTTPDGQFPPRKDGSSAPGFPRPPGGGGRFDNPESLGLGDRCIISFGRNGGPPMFTNNFYNNNYQFVQGRDAVAINIEMVHDTRIVRLNSKHRTDGLRPWFGDSIGWYEGDAFVVETTNIPQTQNYMGAWQDLKVTERFRRVAKDRVLYQFTVESPSTWAKPWGGEYEFGRLNGDVKEYACHEGNYAIVGILQGARAEEKSAKGKGPAD